MVLPELKGIITQAAPLSIARHRDDPSRIGVVALGWEGNRCFPFIWLGGGERGEGL